MDAPTRLFVYGSLAPGRRNAHVLAPIDGSWEAASVRGRLFAAGTWSELDYPGVILDPTGDVLDGLIFTSPDLPAHWPRLDDFEGEDYLRVETRATTPQGQNHSVQIYVIRDDPNSRDNRNSRDRSE